MAYVTADDVRKLLAPDGNTDPSTPASLSDDEINAQIASAQDEIDAALRARYSTPFTDPPKLVKDVTGDFAAYLSTLVHRRGNPLPVDDPIRLRYARARDILAKLSSGSMSLVEETDPGSSEAAVVNPYDGEMFPMEDVGLAPAGSPGFDYYRLRSLGG